MDKKQVAHVFEEIGTLLDLRGENPFKCRAYHNASRIIESLTEDLSTLVQSGEIENIKGIGKGLAEKITELIHTGKLSYYEELKSSLPSGLIEMLRLQGLGPKRIKMLYEKLGIKSLDELKVAAEQHRLSKLEGFGEKTEANILQGLELLKTRSDKHLYPQAREAAEQILSALKKLKEIKRLEYAGSLRRKKEIIGDIDIVASADEQHREKIMRAFVSQADVLTVIAQGDTKSSVVLKSGINCDLRIVEEKEYPFALNYFTGSKEHNVEMRSLARTVGWSLNEYGFSKIEGAKKAKAVPKCKDEADIYRSLGLAYVPPELRENMNEIEAARKNALPDLIEQKDLKGTFHCHTTYSDGANSLQEMAAAAQKRGWSYLGIADHSKVAAYAGGLSPERVKEQHKAIDKLNASFKNFKLFKGTEVDILADGALDFSDKLLATFDYVVASIHSKFKMTEAEATKRIIKALKNKYVTILGHPTGRLLLQRDSYPVNMIEVINAASDYGKSIEINSHPLRLDLDWRLVKYAREKGVPICINPDAHNIDGLDDVQYGIGIARKGWLEAKNVVNCWTVGEEEKFFLSTKS